MDKVLADALKFLEEKKCWGLRDFSRRRYLQSVVERLVPSERMRLSEELSRLSDTEIGDADATG